MAERIISADSHVDISRERVLANLPRQYHEAYEQSSTVLMRKMMEGKPQKQLKNKQGPAAQNTSGPMPSEQPWEAAGRPGAHDPYERIKDMDIDKVDAEILYTNITGGTEFYGLDNDACLASFQAFNSAAIEFSSVNPDRLIPVYILPLHDIEEATKELQRIANEGARAIQLPLYPTECDLAPYWDEVYEPLWSAIAEIGLPISQHVGASDYLMDIMRRDPTPAKGVFQSLPPIFMAEVVASWIVPGVFDRHPNLKVVLVESGLGWIPYYIARLDKMAERHGWEQLGMTLREQPSYYWHHNMFASFEEDEFGIRVRDAIGVENLLWATDYPHPDCTWPHSQEIIHEHFKDVPVDEMRLIVGGNAARIYNL
jgi:predicted TIM-barrel fold metal-dependent hydrolase